jgi:hypothetical protein
MLVIRQVDVVACPAAGRSLVTLRRTTGSVGFALSLRETNSRRSPDFTIRQLATVVLLSREVSVFSRAALRLASPDDSTSQ